MASFPSHLALIPVVIVLISTSCQGQSIAVADNAFDSLDLLGCSKFKTMIQGAGLERRYKSAQSLTLFAFNDTTYRLYGKILNFDVDTDAEGSLNNKVDYIETFTLSEALTTTSFSASQPQRTRSKLGVKLFLNQRKLREGNTASGRVGPTRYFCNGAMVTRANIPAGLHVIHIIDRVLEVPAKSRMLGYITGHDPSNNKQRYKFYTELMQKLEDAATTGNEYTYTNQIDLPLQDDQVTFFIPSDEAVSNIPTQKLSELRENPALLLEIIALHIIPKQVIYTHLVNHNEGFPTQMDSGFVQFRKNFNKEAVYVTGSLRGGGTVTARLFPANRTVLNGVVHQIDRILGYVYKTALEEISTDQVTNNFESFVKTSRRDIQNALAASAGVTVFAPSNNAMQAIVNVYPEFKRNQSLINRVLELSMLVSSTPYALTSQDRGYRSALEMETRHNGRRVKVYSEGNDTWVEGGYVRARVIKPDIGVTNGFVHHIDAVFGVPTRDIVYTIFCEDRLIRTYEQMVFVGLDKYMRDSLLIKNQECSFRNGQQGGSVGIPNRPTNNPNTNDRYAEYRQLCGYGSFSCQFTFFVPNGTAIENFASSPFGKQILEDRIRWRWILRRLMTTREVIHLDRIALGAPRRYIADNGEEVIIQVSSRSNLPSSQRTAYIMFEGVRAEVIHSDIGATNGVIHIINNVVFTQDDSTRDVSGSDVFHLSIIVFVLSLFLSLVH